MKKLFLHIAFNKTGSMSLQRNLSENSAALQQQGILYPYDPGAPYMQRWQHLPLAAAIPGRNVAWLLPKNRAGLAQAYSALHERITASSCNTVVLSSESFGDLDMRRQKVEWLASKFAGFDVTVVAYIRRQYSYFLSTYKEGVKAGRSDPSDFGTHPEAKMLYFARHLAPWREVFGAERVIVRPFDPQRWPEGELFFDFLQLAGAQCSGLFVPPPENKGMDWRALEFLRRLNALNVPLPQGRRRELAALFAWTLTGGRQKSRKSPAASLTPAPPAAGRAKLDGTAGFRYRCWKTDRAAPARQLECGKAGNAYGNRSSSPAGTAGTGDHRSPAQRHQLLL